MEKYTAKYFRDSMPEWKKAKDSIWARLIYRPVSFYLASIAANRHITANQVSYFSAVVALMASACFFIPFRVGPIIGAVLIICWVILDCVDGNLARSVKKQAFGEFADAMSSYLLLGTMGLAMGFAVYFQGGLLFKPGSVLIILIGAIASVSDTMMRLIYQKYRAVERSLCDEGKLTIEKDFRAQDASRWDPAAFVDRELGLGLIPLLAFAASVFHMLDLALLYIFCYSFGSSIVMILKYVRKAMKHAREIQM